MAISLISVHSNYCQIVNTCQKTIKKRLLYARVICFRQLWSSWNSKCHINHHDLGNTKLSVQDMNCQLAPISLINANWPFVFLGLDQETLVESEFSLRCMFVWNELLSLLRHKHRVMDSMNQGMQPLANTKFSN